uniref:Uncharacterized protein n=1 Tax=Leptocylindrus danicus TaxID=163516 RepID=A0A7S2PFT9_9STRA
MAINKMFIMLPLIFASRKLDAEDKDTIFYLRALYFPLHAIILLVMIYIYMTASKFAQTEAGKKVIFVPPAAQPFADPNEKGKKYKQIALGAHVQATAKSLLTSTLFSMCFTSGLHFYRGMVTGMAIQVVMGPFNLFENPLMRLFVLGHDASATRLFEEKHSRDELEPEDSIEDEDGNEIMAAGTIKDSANGGLDEALLDAWDAGDKADVGNLMALLTKTNINDATKENGWAPLMVLSGLACKGTASAMRQMKELGVDVLKKDGEGWNALHWACFHGSMEAAKVLLSPDDFDGIAIGMHEVKDNEGKTPLDLAKAEKNDDVAEIVAKAIASSKSCEAKKDK